MFSFAASQNVVAATPLYPAPRRIDEAGIEAFGYQNEVVFPIKVKPADPAAPVKLVADIDYAVCEALCLPVHAQAELILRPGAPLAPSPQLERALASVPRRLDSHEIQTLVAIEAAPADSRPSWRLNWRGAETGDLFVEAPEGFYVETKRGGAAGQYVLTLVEHPRDKPLPSDATRVTIGGAAPVEFALDLRALAAIPVVAP